MCGVRVLIITESFLPHMNGVTGTVLHVTDYLQRHGFPTAVIAPGSRPEHADVDGLLVHRLRSIAMPGYPQVRVSTALGSTVARAIHAERPDVVHLASPLLLGWHAVKACQQLGIPTVAVYQTDIPEYASRYGMPGLEAVAWSHVARLHRRATLTLAPSTHSTRQLEAAGVPRVARWGRGVDTELFTPGRRDPLWRARIAPAGERIIGYVGRLAPEKQVADLRALADIPGTVLVVIGDGPDRSRLQAELPSARFLGHLSGPHLARAVASLDVFVHPGESETFCQTIQEAHASGVPVVSVGSGGPVDLVDGGRDGWLYTPGNLREGRARLRDLVGDPRKAHAMGAAGRAKVEHRTWGAVCAQLVGYYQQAMASSDATMRTR